MKNFKLSKFHSKSSDPSLCGVMVRFNFEISQCQTIIAKRNKTKVPPVYKRIWTIPSNVDPIDIKINAMTKRVTPKKKVDLIILELIEVVTADDIAKKQKNIINQSSIFFNLFRCWFE